MRDWVVCQPGAREHYAIPRALHAQGRLKLLITDAWVTPTSLLGKLPGISQTRFGERYNADLNGGPVLAFNFAALRRETCRRLLRVSTWKDTLARDAWFQNKAVRSLRSWSSKSAAGRYVLFSYSYTARRLFEYARSRGWMTVLGQIDPGFADEEIVRREQSRHEDLDPAWSPAPAEYWDSWRAECALADRIVVNSEWSRRALSKTGVKPTKISVIPLAYEKSGREDFQRHYPKLFTQTRKLRALFLGLATLRKGIAMLLEAASLLRDEPIEFWVVGEGSSIVEARARSLPNIVWHGPVSRASTERFYREADVYIFPTLSDGFGLTQLEAQSWKLPVIASPYCGEVVKNNVNGVILKGPSAEEICSSLRIMLKNPGALETYSQNSLRPSAFGLEQLQTRIKNLCDEL